MSTFIRVTGENQKEQVLANACRSLCSGTADTHVFQRIPESFEKLPGSPFAYWLTESLIEAFVKLPKFADTGRSAWIGLQTNDDLQWLRLWWEAGDEINELSTLRPIAKGGSYAQFFSDIHLCVRWGSSGELIKLWKSEQLRLGKITANNSKCWNEKDYLRPGLTWSLRTTKGLSVRVLPSGCIFGNKGPAAFSTSDKPNEILQLLAVMNSEAFKTLVAARVAAADSAARSYDVGIVETTPTPSIDDLRSTNLDCLSLRAWTLRRKLGCTEETSHIFLLPEVLRESLGDSDPVSIEVELKSIQAEIDDIAFDLYGFSDADRATALGSSGAVDEDDGVEDATESEDDDGAEKIDQTDGLLSWAAGVAFGRFDWRLATGEREAPPESEPFDPLPAKSPGMLPDDSEPFHAHSGILVDDQGHPNDLARLIEEVLARVEAPVPADVRRWLQRDFFTLHLKQYSKSRRKAPIYWPISTSSGSYTLWLYYPSLTSQTLYTAVNDFIEGPTGKLQQVEHDLVALRSKGSARSAADEKNFEKLQALEAELIELRETILEIAPKYRPNHDDGVQISAAPLWRLFRHKPWQKILKATWEKLEKGDYDWAHLAMAYWPERVREKCKTDKSLAIAHDLEDLYEEPEVTPGAKRGRTKTGGTT
ncbi:BREX-1 system adenine-specific DNA-methyltransferase PglX [Planktomarina sp.]|nr:BREX-1 system adenine-specific DNA-methyltransferase PglX [Planktomarina sp.]